MGKGNEPYIKLPVGFAYLAALIDVYSRRIMGWRLSNSMSRTFCLEALEDAGPSLRKRLTSTGPG